MPDELKPPRFEGAQLIIETSNETEVYDSKFLVAALLVYSAKGDGQISPVETSKMLELIGGHFHLRSSESLELLTDAMEKLAENPDLSSILSDLGTVLTSKEKEDVAVMLLKVIAADGRHDAKETDVLSNAVAIIDISPESLHQAYNRYFADKAG